MRHRKRVVGKLEFIGTKIRFSAWDPFKEDCLYEYLVLKLVHQIRDCEARIREKELRGMCTAERMNFQLVLGELERKLTILNRDFFF
ncbi:hypothetical protein B9Z55_004548 [Caenorhabditis nigoni]|uniref:Uncharacterized protein n=1 Tax=Caenorhabditis nigoni TaxID=1611254 RepID=A0A2G5UX04_9PELO|nr:hypothetical protein B9Z55_004548 [Caenorhabditis nigoni]